MRTIVKLFSDEKGEILNFLKSFYNTNEEEKLLANNQTLEWEKIYENPIEMVDIIGSFIENNDHFKINMWISLDAEALINVTSSNADDVIRYLYERFPY